MEELIRSTDMVVLAALKAALSAEGIPVFKFDGDISSMCGGIELSPRLLMVRSEDIAPATEVAKAICPDQFH